MANWFIQSKSGYEYLTKLNNVHNVENIVNAVQWNIAQYCLEARSFCHGTKNASEKAAVHVG